jgi:hypothetical protein
MKTTPSAHLIQQLQATTYSTGKCSEERTFLSRYVRKMRSTFFHCNSHANRLKEREKKGNSAVFLGVQHYFWNQEEGKGDKEVSLSLD